MLLHEICFDPRKRVSFGFRSQLFKTIFLKQKMSFNMAAMAQKFDKTYRMAGGHT
jgi:hypothetical protein